MALSSDTRARLMKLAGLLASNHEGEQLAALGKCNDLLRANKATWADALSPPTQAVTIVNQPPPPPPVPRTWRNVAEEALVFHPGALRVTDRYDEPQFLQDLLARGRAPTTRQATWLADIAHRCGLPTWDGSP
jgi:hypothetical protein